MLLDKTVVLRVSETLDGPDDIKNLSYAADIIRFGGTVCFPTETVYGLGANALNAGAVLKIFEAKGRPQDNPLIIHLDTVDKAEQYCHAAETRGFNELKHFMPGPLTVIMPKRECIPYEVTAQLENVAVRVPVNKVANKFLELCNLPVAAPSANLSGKPSPTCAEHVIRDLYGKVDVIIDGGNADVGLESTIVTLASDPPMLLRPGAVTYEQLCEALGEVAVSPAILSEMKPGEVAAAPGMKYKHYAPNAPVFLVIGEDETVRRYLRDKQQEEKAAFLVFDEDRPYLRNERIFPIGRKEDAAAHARHIFAALRDTDTLEGLDAVYVHITDDKSGLNLAVFNRLLKASAYHIIRL